jgi:hypothetical protein
MSIEIKRVRVSDEVQVAQTSVNKEIAEKFNFPGHINEAKLRVTENRDKEMQKNENQFVREEMKEAGYIELTNLTHIKEIFVDNYDDNIRKYFNGGHLFFVWQYSQLLKVTEMDSERKAILDKLKPIDKVNIVKYIKDSGICRTAMFIDMNGKPERSRDNKLVTLNKKGKKHWVADGTNTKNYVPKRDYFDIYDLSIPTIKKAMEDLQIKIK